MYINTFTTTISYGRRLDILVMHMLDIANTIMYIVHYSDTYSAVELKY